MTFLADISDEALGLGETGKDKTRFRLRRAARLILFDANGRIAFLHAARDGYHKLPGGGMEAGENWETAAHREALEETGCTVTLRPQMIGDILEYRCAFDLKQISSCGIADILGAPGPCDFTDDEKDVGLTLKWVTLDDAIALLTKDSPDDYEGKFIKARDLCFLQTAKDVLAK